MNHPWTIIYTDHQNKFIHLDHLVRSNPEAQILCADTSNHGFEPYYAWRNCDRISREWLRSNIRSIKHTNIAIVEWDTLISETLPDISVNGLMCKDVFKNIPESDTWVFWKEIPLLEHYKNYALAGAPMALLFIDIPTAYCWISEEFDTIYNKDIFCELRLASILNFKEIPISSYSMPNVFWDKCTYNKNYGIHHPIKSSIVIDD